MIFPNQLQALWCCSLQDYSSAWHWKTTWENSTLQNHRWAVSRYVLPSVFKYSFTDITKLFEVGEMSRAKRALLLEIKDISSTMCYIWHIKDKWMASWLCSLAHCTSRRCPYNSADFALRVEPGSFHTFPVHDGGDHHCYRNGGKDATHANPIYCPRTLLEA